MSSRRDDEREFGSLPFPFDAVSDECGIENDLLSDEVLDGDLVDLADAYPVDYLLDCANDEAREDRLAELKRRIELKAYNVDTDRIAEEMLDKGLLD